MADENVITNPQEEDSNQMYLDQINKLKESTVSRQKYDQLMQDNKNLLESLVNGSGVSTEAKIEDFPKAEDLRKELFASTKKEFTNLDYCKKALELRAAVLREENKDIFVGSGHNITPSREAYESAERVATVMQECVDYANGDSQVFTNELMRRTNDVKIPGLRR